MEINYNTETLGNTTYFSAVSERGHTTTVFNMDGTTFVQTNKTPARAIQDIAKPTKLATALIEIMEAA